MIGAAMVWSVVRHHMVVPGMEVAGHGRSDVFETGSFEAGNGAGGKAGGRGACEGVGPYEMPMAFDRRAKSASGVGGVGGEVEVGHVAEGGVL